MPVRRRFFRVAAAYAVWPVVMGGSLAAAGWGLARGIGAPVWALTVSTITFLAVVAAEHAMPAVPGWTLFRDRQSFNDIGHGLLIAALSRPPCAWTIPRQMASPKPTPPVRCEASPR